jgi:hypothetical protein
MLAPSALIGRINTALTSFAVSDQARLAIAVDVCFVGAMFWP